MAMDQIQVEDKVGAEDIACSEGDDSIICEAKGPNTKIVRVAGKVGDAREYTLLCPEDVDTEKAVFNDAIVSEYSDFYSVLATPDEMEESLEKQGCKNVFIKSDETEITKDRNVDTKQDVIDLGVETPEKDWIEANV